MDQALSSWAALALVVGILAVVAIWARRSTKARGLAVAGFLASIPLTGGTLIYSLGWPAPYANWSFVQIKGGDFTVLGVKLVVGEGIYALLDTGSTPRYFVMPWDKEMASKLQDLMESQREGETGEPRLKLPPMEWSWERRKPPLAYALPQEKVLPQKPAQATPKRFESI